jgi:hypothetical protein
MPYEHAIITSSLIYGWFETFLSQIPGSLHKLVSDKLARVVQGEQPDVTGKISI